MRKRVWFLLAVMVALGILEACVMISSMDIEMRLWASALVAGCLIVGIIIGAIVAMEVARIPDDKGKEADQIERSGKGC